MLAVATRIVVNHNSVLQAHWEPQDRLRPEHRGMMLEGKTLAVIGLGGIGTVIAKRARAFDMRIVGIRRHPQKGGEHVDAVYGMQDLHKVLAEADFVMLATPITEETTGFMDADAIAAMKPTAVLVNVARGNLIQEMPTRSRKAASPASPRKCGGTTRIHCRPRITIQFLRAPDCKDFRP